MIRLRVLFALALFMSFEAPASLEDLGNVNKDHKHFKKLSQIKVEVGGVAVLDQVAEAENNNGPMFLTFQCEKGVKNQSQCRLIRLDLPKKDH